MKLYVAAAVMGMLFASTAYAIEPLDFPSEEARERYQEITWELRCPKCQNQNISDSDAPLAKDLRQQVHRMVVEGQSDEEIVNYMVSRYGDFILYRPRLEGRTLVLWLGPIVLAAIGIGVVLWLGRRRRNVRTPSLSAEEHARAASLLQSDKSDKLS